MMNIGRNIFQDAYMIYRDNEADNQLQHAEDMAHAQDLRNYERQKEFAQMGIQWRVKDAQAAGLHPVFALGGGGAAYSPGSISVGSPHSSSSFGGHDMRRSVQSTQSVEERFRDHLQTRIMMEQLRGQIIENDIKAGTNRFGPSQVGPGIPSAVRGGDGVLMEEAQSTTPAERISALPTDLSSTSADPSPASERFILKSFDGRDVVVRLPSTGKGDFSQSIEALSESLPLLWATLKDNLRENPSFLYDFQHMIPGMESIFHYGGPVARALERTAQWYLNQKKIRRSLDRDAEIWNRSGRERGINWRSGR